MSLQTVLCARMDCRQAYRQRTWNQRYCSDACAEIMRWRQHTQRAKIAPTDVESYVELGLLRRPERCPHCDGPCRQEPALSVCQMCGRTWPLAGARLSDQIRWEYASGLRCR